MSLALFPVSSAQHAIPPRRRGRPAVADDPREQAKHLAVATERYVHRRPLKQLAARYDASERSILRWCRLALRYEGPIAEYLRQLARR